MKIVHICLCQVVTDGFLYQENLLSKYHKKMGYNVSLITSQWCFNTEGQITMTNKSEYYNNDGVYMIRLFCKNTNKFTSKLKSFSDLTKTLVNEKPDIIFIHGVQFWDMFKVVGYVKDNSNIQVYVDNHADFNNSGKNFFSKFFLHKFIWRHMALMISPYTIKFYGVLPIRVKFLTTVYRIPNKRCELLLLGADDDEVIRTEKPDLIQMVKNQLKIQPDDFVIVTGGKIDLLKKQTLLLMQIINGLKALHVKLVIFGSISVELKGEFERLLMPGKTMYVGWADATKSYEYFAIANIIIFPGQHSIYWEQAVGQGKPLICKYLDGGTHIDIGGNVIFLKEDFAEKIKAIIEELCEKSEKYQAMEKAALSDKRKEFRYSQIAKNSIKR